MKSFLSRKGSSKILRKKSKKNVKKDENEHEEEVPSSIEEDDFRPVDLAADMARFRERHEKILQDETLNSPVTLSGAKGLYEFIDPNAVHKDIQRSSSYSSFNSSDSSDSGSSMPRSNTKTSDELLASRKISSVRSSKLEGFFGDAHYGEKEFALGQPSTDYLEIANPEQEMHKVFHEDIPKEEDLIGVFPVHWDAKHPGKMYLTTHFILFHAANEKGDTKFKRIIPYKEVLYFAKQGNRLRPMVEFTTTKSNFSVVSHQGKLFKQLEATAGQYLEHNLNLNEAINNLDMDKLRILLNPENKAKFPNLDLTTPDEDKGLIPLHNAVRTGDTRIVTLFVQYYEARGLDINEKDSQGWTVLHVASYYNYGKPGEDEVFKLLLNIPTIEVNTESIDGNTPLHYFCQQFKSPACQDLGELLISKGCPVNKMNKTGETALHKAIFNSAVRILMVKLLIQGGADVNIPTNKGETALHYAVRLRRKDLMKILLNAGADITIKSQASNNKTPYELAISEKTEPMAEALKSVQELYDWLKSMELQKLYSLFVKEELYLDMLADPEYSIDKILDSPNLDLTVGVMITLRKGIIKLRENFKAMEKKKQEEKAFLSRISNVLNVSSPNLFIKQEDLEFTDKLGGGAAGKVYKGLYKGEEVAIKVLKASDAEVEEEFKKEFKVMSTIQTPHIVKLIGACASPKLCIVMEYCSRKSLYHVLNNEKQPIGWELGLKLAYEMVAGLTCFHTYNPPIYHRDMKSLNILVTEGFDAKLTDFGLARFSTPNNMNTMMHMVGTVGWTAPELLQSEMFTDKSDIYSVGIILWEVVYRVVYGKYQRPFGEYPDMNDLQIMVQSSEHGLRPTVPPLCPPRLATLIRNSVAKDPAERPKCTEVDQELKEMLADVRANPSSWPTVPIPEPPRATSADESAT